MKKLTKLRIFKFGTIISGLITLILFTTNIFFKYVVRFMLGIHKSIGESSSIEIIGGVDGPTAVFFVSQSLIGIKYILIILFFIITIIYAVKWRKLCKEN